MDMPFMDVGNPGNADDTHGDGYGGVGYEYRIGKFEVTAGQYADTMGIGVVNLEAGVFQRHTRGGDGIGDKRLHAFGFFFFHEIIRVKRFDLTGNFRSVAVGIKPCNLTDPGFAGTQSRPALVDANT
jgi:hypothetical protein